MNNQPRVMLLIDADNVSADVIDQAVAKVQADHGAIHVRRAYCTAESALANLKLFKAHSIRPIVNLSTGKNSTDIALAVDAVDLVICERPDVVVVVSSDSDFAPLVIKLREKGCRVEGIGQLGKTGEDSKPVYDGFTDIAHRKAGGGSVSAPRKRARAGASRAEPSPHRAPTSARDAAPLAGRSSPSNPARREVSKDRFEPPKDRQAEPGDPAALAAAPALDPVPAPGLAPAPAPAPAKRTRTRRSPANAPEVEAPVAASDPPSAVDAADTAAAPASSSAPAPVPAPVPTPTPTAPAAAARMPDALRRILAVLPELARGGTLDLGIAAERLRSEDLLARSATSTRLFRQHPEWFELSPERQPNKVKYRGFLAP